MAHDATALQPAVFLDRDGTLNRERDFLRGPDELEVLPGVRDAMRRLHEAGFLLVVLTNQSGIARGYLDEAMLARIHERLAAELGGVIAGFLHCPHLPDAAGPYGGECGCRKPKDGLLRDALALWPIDRARSFVVGDSARDLAYAPDMARVLVQSGKPLDDAARAQATVVVADLAAAAEWILEFGRRETGLRGPLRELLEALVAAGETYRADQVRDALSGTPQELARFLTSNELWGGAGSIADQSGIPGDRRSRRPIEAALIALGDAQLRAAIVNVRTGMWVEAFKAWREQGI